MARLQTQHLLTTHGRRAINVVIVLTVQARTSLPQLARSRTWLRKLLSVTQGVKLIKGGIRLEMILMLIASPLTMQMGCPLVMSAQYVRRMANP